MSSKLAEELSGGSRRSGLGAYLAATRLLLGNRVSRLLFLTLTKRVSCEVNSVSVERSALECALASLAGETISRPLHVRIVSSIVDAMLRAGVTLLGGDMKAVRDALRDPAVRRGVTLVLSDIAKYGVTASQKLPAPFLIVWNFTNMCNLRCKHRYQRAERPC